MIERQVIVTWHEPSEKLPPNEYFVVATVSGKVRHVTFDHTFMIANWVEGEGWYFFHDAINTDSDCDLITVNAWCDLEPYGG